jgi:putative Holliday junction resolvase
VGEANARVLALDLGSRRMGLAISDDLGWTAQGLATLERKTLRADLDALAALAAQRQVRRIVVGNPLHMSGDESPGSRAAASFARKLQRRTGLPVELWDERLTSHEASVVLRASGLSIAKRARAVDRLAAVLLLSSYLEHHNEPSEVTPEP